eukprot:gene32773-33836_t
MFTMCSMKQVSKQELMQLHLLAIEYVKLQNLGRSSSQDDDGDDPLQPPDSLPALLSAMYKVFDRTILASLSSADVRMVGKAMQVQDIIHSYGISRMLQDYIEGSRVWLYQKLTDWLDTDSGSATPSLAISRVFMFLSGPGMGKSVFSAMVANKLTVRSSTSTSGHKRPIVSAYHFFKVNEARSQAKAMIRCLAVQLTERLPGMASKLAAVIEKSGAGASMSTTELFAEYILHPLQQLAEEAEKCGDNLPPIVLLLDALDEADDGGQGWLPVLLLISKDFARLPKCVRIVLTSRPEARAGANGQGTCYKVADLFKEWNPVQLQPSAKENMEDVKLVVKHRLLGLGLVEEDDMEEQVREVQERSQGEFVWLKFAFDLLSKQASGAAPSKGGEDDTLSRVDYEFNAYDLPKGRVGMYQHLLSCVRISLLADESKAYLWELLQGRILPVLLVVREAPTLDELAWLSGVRKSDVQEGLELLELLFPKAQQQQGRMESQAGSTDRIFPFHKSVLDFLSSKEDASSHNLFVDAEAGLQLCATACRLQDGQKWGDDIDALFDNDYATKNAIYHLARAKDVSGLRERALDLRRWVLLANNEKVPNAFMSNATDLLVYVIWNLKLDSGDELYNVYRWLCRDCLKLAKYPKNVAQTAMEVPASSELHKRAMHINNEVENVFGITLPRQFPRSRYSQWPPALQVFQTDSGVSAISTLREATAGGFVLYMAYNLARSRS